MICSPCARALRKPGRHRRHDCTGGGETWGRIDGRVHGVGWTCNCVCFQQRIAAIESHGGFPSMALDRAVIIDDLAD